MLRRLTTTRAAAANRSGTERRYRLQMIRAQPQQATLLRSNRSCSQIGGHRGGLCGRRQQRRGRRRCGIRLNAGRQTGDGNQAERAARYRIVVGVIIVGVCRAVVGAIRAVVVGIGAATGTGTGGIVAGVVGVGGRTSTAGG